MELWPYNKNSEVQLSGAWARRYNKFRLIIFPEENSEL